MSDLRRIADTVARRLGFKQAKDLPPEFDDSIKRIAQAEEIKSVGLAQDNRHAVEQADYELRQELQRLDSMQRAQMAQDNMIRWDPRGMANAPFGMFAGRGGGKSNVSDVISQAMASRSGQVAQNVQQNNALLQQLMAQQAQHTGQQLMGGFAQTAVSPSPVVDELEKIPDSALGLNTMKLEPAQQDAVTHVYERGQTFLIGQMGSGKTAVALHAAHELLRAGEIERVLVFAPPRVVDDVWPEEHLKWPGLDLHVGIAVGTPKQRQAIINDRSNEVICLSFDNMAWFFKTYGERHGFDMLVIDELTKMKGGGNGFKKMRARLNDFEVRLGMTGTPVSEDWQQLFYQMFCVDAGKTFTRNRENFLNEYFTQDYNGYSWTIKPDSAARLADAIEPYTVVLPDYTKDLPKLHEHVLKLDMPAEAKAYYDQLERDQVNEHVVADSAALLVSKLQQVASGFIYTDDDWVEPLHQIKTMKLSTFKQRPLVVVYQFGEELHRLKQLFPNAFVLTEDDDALKKFRHACDGAKMGATGKPFNDEFTEYKDRVEYPDEPVLLLHPKSAGHGVDLTCACHMVFVSPIWSHDMTAQCISRIWRRGQKNECHVTTLCANDTIDLEVVSRERGKATHHETLMKRLNYIDRDSTPPPAAS